MLYIINFESVIDSGGALTYVFDMAEELAIWPVPWCRWKQTGLWSMLQWVVFCNNLDGKQPINQRSYSTWTWYASVCCVLSANVYVRDIVAEQRGPTAIFFFYLNESYPCIA
jgi:hypothetical protein